MNSLNHILLSLVLVASLWACQGPGTRTRQIPLTIDSQGLAVQWQDGPRRDAAEAEMRREARKVVSRLFRGEPMPTIVRSEAQRPSEGELAGLHDDEGDVPSWANGVPKPPAVLEHDLPRGWPIEVRRGETVALLAKWGGTDARTLLTDNADFLKRRRWLKTGDRLMVTMSANQKVAFDKARQEFQQGRLDAYFSKRYFEKVVVYRVKRGEFIATAAKRYGDVPLWLLEEFNQTDFRTLHAGAEVLIPVVASYEAGQSKPRPMTVVDEDGRPLSDDRKETVARKLRGDLIGRARLALDDSNVFERGEGVFSASARELLPDYQQAHARPAVVANLGNAPPVGAAAPVDRPPATVARDVIIKRGETLMHYIQWSGVTLDEIKAANPHLDPQHILVGSRLALPLTDIQYVDFVKARAAWVKDKANSVKGKLAKPSAANPKPVAATAPERVHEVRPGETATAIASRYKVSLRDLRRVNARVDLDRIRVGQRLAIP